MFKYYNSNVLKKNVDDCTIRSISVATGKSWDYVYDYLSDLAQEQGTMMNSKEFIIGFLDSRYDRVPRLYDTVGNTVKHYPKNILLVTMNGHITCAKNGIIYDTFNPSDRRIEDAWIVE